MFFFFCFPLNLVTHQIKQCALILSPANSDECFKWTVICIRTTFCITFSLQFKLTKYGLCTLLRKIHILAKKSGIPGFQRKRSVFHPDPETPCFPRSLLSTDPGTPYSGDQRFPSSKPLQVYGNLEAVYI